MCSAIPLLALAYSKRGAHLWNILHNKFHQWFLELGKAMPIISAVWGYIFGEKNLLPEHQCYSPEKKNNSSLLLSIQLCFGFGFFFFWLLPPFILLLPGPLLSPLPQKEFACPPWIWCQSHQENVQAKKSWHKSAWLCSCRWRCVGLHTAWENWMPGLFCDHFVFIHSSFKFSITVLPWKLINIDPKPICTLFSFCLQASFLLPKQPGK